ncbi:MAG: tRNA (adenosine(37)-N6)-threonylcarbamoyltransferase complex transferase subunit TsaD [bacterium]
MKILGLETSCDETAAAVVEVKGGRFKVLSNIVSSQVAIHRRFGGVVPEVAARNHLKNMIFVVDRALHGNGLSKIDLVAVNYCPGLITSLIVGVETAKALAYSLNKPLIGVDHLNAHLAAVYLDNPKIKYPALGLLVSGGHTQLIIMKKPNSFKVIGQTLDDAAGEAFDKVAKILKLGYPGGPIISRLAQAGQADAYALPRPMINKGHYDFSFSGLKTAVLYLVKGKKLSQKQVKDLCASFEQAVVDVLIAKTLKAAREQKVKTIILAGGVAANRKLRANLAQAIQKELPQVNFQVPAIEHCTDNAAMTAVAGYFVYQKRGADNLFKLTAQTD